MQAQKATLTAYTHSQGLSKLVSIPAQGISSSACIVAVLANHLCHGRPQRLQRVRHGAQQHAIQDAQQPRQLGKVVVRGVNPVDLQQAAGGGDGGYDSPGMCLLGSRSRRGVLQEVVRQSEHTGVQYAGTFL
jgi:hypothetical protein